MRTSILCAAPFRGIDLSDEKRRTLPSGVVVLFLPLLFFDHEVVKIARDSFGDRFIGEFGRIVVLCYLKDKFAAFEAKLCRSGGLNAQVTTTVLK